MTPEQVRIVQSTWLKVLPLNGRTAQIFYDRLFEIDPSLRSLFRIDIREQGQKLMQVIDFAVNGLGRFERVVPMIEALGRRHVSYGVRDEHYGAVGSAFLWTLEKSLGAEFTPTVKDAWATLYSELATTMRAAARGELDGASRAEAQATVFNKAMRHEMGRTRLVAVATALGLVAATAWGIHLKADSVPAIEPPLTVAAPAPPDPARFLLHALLVPALDGDALPLRWVDPWPASGCGPHTTVHVNGEPLVAGALVPVKACDLEWQADGCHPLGAGGPRFDGRVKLTVFREDWGFSAMVEPAGAHVTSTDNVTTAIQPGAVTLTQTIERENAVTEMAACAHSSQPCACALWSQPCY